MHEFLGQFADDRRDSVGRRQVVDRLCKGDKNTGHPQLSVKEIFDDVRVETKNTEFMWAHDAREQLHDKNFVIQRKALVVGVEHVIEFLAKGLGIVE